MGPPSHRHRTGGREVETLVLGPSIGTNLHLLDAQAEALSDTYRVVRFDLRGHGRSPVEPGSATVADLADDVLRLVDDLGVSSFHYAGVSLGGAIGQHLAITAPARIRNLIVIASAARFANPASWTERAARVRAEGTEFLVPSRTGAWFTADFLQKHPHEAGRLLDMLRTTSREGCASCCEAIGAFDVRDRLAAVAAPTLVIAGGVDPATPPGTVKIIAENIPGSRFEVVADASHLLNAEKPGTVNRLIRAHLDGLWHRKRAG